MAGVWNGEGESGPAAAGRPAACGCALGTRTLPRAQVLRAERRTAAHQRRLPTRVRPHGGRCRWRVEGPLALPEADHLLPPPCPLDGGMHHHERHRVVCVTAGLACVAGAWGRTEVRGGDVLVFAPGDPHGVTADAEDPPCLLAVEFVPGAVLSGGEHRLVTRIFDGRPVIRCSRAAAREAERLVHLIRAEQRRGRAAGAVAVRAYLMALLVLLYRRRQRNRSAPPRELVVEPALREAQQLMEEHFAEPVRLADLADRAHLSVRQFTARFKRAFGVTPLQYLTRLRVAAAQELLCRSDQGVAAIAREVGYENLSHFYRTFVQHTGMPPGRYRQALPDPPS